MYDFKYEAVFSYLKSGLSLLSTEEIDILENYVLAYGIKGWKWRQDTWDYGIQREGAEAVDAVNLLRDRVLAPFAPLLAFPQKKAFPLREFLQALLSHL